MFISENIDVLHIRHCLYPYSSDRNAKSMLIEWQELSQTKCVYKQHLNSEKALAYDIQSYRGCPKPVNKLKRKIKPPIHLCPQGNAILSGSV